MSEEPREYWLCMPRKYSPGDCVTPRWCPGKAVWAKDRQVDPGVVRAVAGCPHHGVYVEFMAAGEPDGPACGAGGAAEELDAVAAGELAQASADQQVAALGAAPPGIERGGGQPEVVAE